MDLHLSFQEAQSLKAALDTYLPELEFELARTEDRGLQHVLHTRFDCLQRVFKAVESDLGTGGSLEEIDLPGRG